MRKEIVLPSQFSATTRALANDTSRYALVAWLLAGALLAAWSAWFFFSKVTVYEISRKARLEVARTAHAVAAPVAGKVVSASMAIGEEIRAGAVLIELDASSEKLRLREVQSRLRALAPRIASLKKEIASLEQAGIEDQRSASAAAQAARSRTREARAAMAFAEEHERRLKEESDAGSIAQIEALRALADAQKLRASSEALSSEVRRLELDARTRAHQSRAQIESLKREVVVLEGEMATTEVTIVRLDTDIGKHVVRAPVAGRIGDAVPLRAGAYVAAGQNLATVVPAGELMIIADFAPAAVLGRLRPGQHARLRLDGFPWAQYGSIEATVSRVATEIRDGLVRVEFVPASQAAAGVLMQHGLPGSIEVSVDEAAPAVLLLRASGQLLSRPERQANPVGEASP
jgi:multidrug resistance efflux pump